MNNYTLIIYKRYGLNKWIIRPIEWAGIWKIVDNEHELVSGNVMFEFDTREEAEKKLEEMKNEKSNCRI